MKILELEQNTPEWEAFRRTHIGASDSPAICGVDPYTTPYMKWKEKAIGEKPKFNDAMQQGSMLEPEARELAERFFNMKLPPIVVQHSTLNFMMASLDGFNPLKGAILEIKTAGDNIFDQTEQEGPLLKWIYQVHHQMECVGNIDRAFIFVMHRNSRAFHPFTIERDDKIISEIVEKGKEFYERIINFDPPADTHRERDDVTWRQLAESLRATKAIADEAEAKLQELRNKIIEACEGESCKGFGISATKYTPKGAVDYKSIPEIKDIDLNKYRKPSKETWRVA